MTDMRDDFIGCYRNAMPSELCDRMVEAFEVSDSAGLTYNRRRENRTKDFAEDDALGTLGNLMAFSAHLNAEFTKNLWSAYRIYADRYEVALTAASDEHSVYEIKLQRTRPGQGYHKWHYEAASRAASVRLLAYTVYLNDVVEGGETEFLYYHRRVRPEKGMVCIFPAAFTHLHRGNPPLVGDKYIATGWFEF